MIWIGGFVLAVALYLIGPDRFIDACWNFVDSIDAAVQALVAAFGERAYGAVRAFAIAIYVVFAVLCVLGSMRGRGGFWPFLVVSALFALLTWRPFGFYPAPLSRWLVSLVLVVVGAALMTQRLVAAPVRRDGPPPPYPPGRAP